MIVHNFRAETKRGIEARAKRAGHCAEQEGRRIPEVAVDSSQRVKVGSALAAVARRFGGIGLDLRRDPTPAGRLRFKKIGNPQHY